MRESVSRLKGMFSGAVHTEPSPLLHGQFSTIQDTRNDVERVGRHDLRKALTVAQILPSSAYNQRVRDGRPLVKVPGSHIKKDL
jgi:hypothetical protein